MFFETNIVVPTRIDTILSSENPLLTDILDEDDVIQQCVGQNTKLINFLCSEKTFDELLGYILADPDPQLDVSLQYKYPSRACEVLTCEIPELTAKLAESEDNITKIFSFIDLRTHPVTPLQASFCVKLIQHLFKMRTKTLFDFMEKRSKETVAIFASSLHLPCLVDLLLQFASPVEDVDSGLPTSNGFLNPLVEAGLPGVVIDALSPAEASETTRDAATNASQFACEIIRSGSSPLATAILNDKSIDTMFSLMFPENSVAPEFVLYHGFGIVNTVLSQDHSGFDHSELKVGSSSLSAMDDFDNIDAVTPADGVSSAPSHAPLSSSTGHSAAAEQRQLPDYVQRLLDRLLNHMPQIRALIDNAPPQYPSSRLCLSSTVNCENVEEIAPLGRLRLRLVETVQLLVEQRDPKLDEAVAENDLLQSTFQVFLRYKWNSLLHNTVERICSIILSTSGQDKPLLKKLLCDCNFVRMLLDVFHAKEKQGNRCPGYTGQILLMANDLSRALETNKAEVTKLVSDENMEDWRKFESETLAGVNERNKPDRLSAINSAINNASSTSAMMMMMAGGIVGSTLTLKGQRLRIGIGRNVKPGVSDEDEDEDDDMEDSDRHGDDQFSIDNVLKQMQSEYQKQDLSPGPLASFNTALSGLELDPHKSVLGNLPPLPRVPMTVLPPEHRRKLGDSSDEESDEDMNDHEQAFETACEERVKLPSAAPIAKPQRVSSDSDNDDDDDDNLWRDDEVQQGSFETAKHAPSQHMFEDSHGNVREVKESEWNPFTSSTPEQQPSSASPTSNPNSGVERMEEDVEDSSSESNHTSSGEDEASDFSPFADFSAVSGSEWPGATGATGATTGNGGSSDDWPGAGADKMETSFDAKFPDAFPISAATNESGEPEEKPSSMATDSLTFDQEAPKQPSKIPPAIPPRVGIVSLGPSNNSTTSKNS